MTPAEQALDNALHCEMKKIALRQSKDGVVISFVLHPHEIPDALQQAAIGSRYMVALVQIGDDELPITQTVKENKKDLNSEARTAAAPSLTPDMPSGKASARQWRDIQPAQQAGIRCSDPIFVTYLKERYPEDWRALEEDAAELVRYLCGVNSRAKLNTLPNARAIWTQLDDEFQAWKVLEGA